MGGIVFLGVCGLCKLSLHPTSPLNLCYLPIKLSLSTVGVPLRNDLI